MKPVALLLLTAAPLLAELEAVVHYVCPEGESFTAYYSRSSATDEARALVRLEDGSEVALPRVRAASGAKYSNGFTTVWAKGDEALIESGSLQARGCRAAENVRLSGMFTYLADSAHFLECASQTRLPVAMEGGYPALEKAYLEQRAGPGAPLYVTVEGRIERRPPMEGEGDVVKLVVEKFVSAEPGGRCRDDDAQSLEGRWDLIELAGGEVPPTASPAFLEFDPQQSRVAGSTARTSGAARA